MKRPWVEQLRVDSPENELARREEMRLLLAHLGKLSERERELVGLRHAAGLTNREIARILKLSEANVAQILHRTIVKLRRWLDEEAVR